MNTFGLYEITLGPKYKNLKKVSFPVKEYITTIADAPQEFENIVMSKEEIEELRYRSMKVGALIVTAIIVVLMLLIS